MGRPRRAENAIATEERLLAAAEAEFARHGFAAARLEDIADTAGVRRPSLLYHFGSKEELYEKTVHRVFEGLRAALVRAMSGTGTFEERLDRTVGDYVGFLLAHPDLARIFLREVLDADGPGRPYIEREVAPLLALAERFVREGGGKRAAKVDVRGALLLVVAGAVVYAVAGDLRSSLYRKAPPAEFAAAAIDFSRRLVLSDAPPPRPSPRRRRS